MNKLRDLLIELDNELPEDYYDYDEPVDSEYDEYDEYNFSWDWEG